MTASVCVGFATSAQCGREAPEQSAARPVRKSSMVQSAPGEGGKGTAGTPWRESDTCKIGESAGDVNGKRPGRPVGPAAPGCAAGADSVEGHRLAALGRAG